MSTSTVKWSYLKYGCTVLADNTRSFAYHSWACANEMYPSDCIPTLEDCSCDLDDPLTPFVDPITDSAPWYDPNVPESSEFLGLMILKVDGARDSTYSRDSFDAFNEGSILARPRILGRSFAVRALVMSTSCEGNDYGLEWLRKILEDQSCLCDSSDPCELCGENQMQLRVTCGDEIDCDNGLRTWDSVGTVDGISVINNKNLEDCCCVAQEISFTLQSERPHSFTCDEVVLDEDLKPCWMSAVDDSSPQLWYRLGDASGTVAKEEIIGHGGAYSGGVTLGEPALIVNSLDPSVAFDGVDGVVAAPDHPVMNVGTGAFTIEAWFKSSAVSSQNIIACKRTTTGLVPGWWIGTSSSGVLRLRISDGVTELTHDAGAINQYLDGVEHHIVAGRDASGDTVMIVDGVVLGTPQAAGALDTDSAGDLEIGACVTAASHASAIIDEVLWYAREMPADEALHHYEAGSTPPYCRCYDWESDCKECCDDSDCDRCGYDALCTCFAAESPEVVLLTDDCFCEPLAKTIQCVCIDDIGTVYDTALSVAIFSGADATDKVFTDLGMRNVRIRAWDNPDNLPCPIDNATYEAFCTMEPRFDLKVSYIPSNATLTVDGRKERVTLECDGVCRPYAQVVSSTTGSIFPLIANCEPLTLCIEFDTLNTQYDSTGPKLPSSLTVAKFRRWRN